MRQPSTPTAPGYLRGRQGVSDRRSLVRVVVFGCLLLVWMSVVARAAPATTEPPPADATTTTTVDAPPDPNAPPVVVEPEIEEPDEDPWTARFMAPAMAVLGIVIFVIVVVYYIVRIRGRYEVVG